MGEVIRGREGVGDREGGGGIQRVGVCGKEGEEEGLLTCNREVVDGEVVMVCVARKRG